MELQVYNKTYNIPEYLTIEKYMEMVKLEGLIKDPIKLLNAYTDIPEDIIRKADKQNIQFILAMIQSKYLNYDKEKVQATFEFKGKKYGLQKNLNEINYGGWVDLEMCIADGIEKNVDTIMSILYRPLKWTMGSKYEIEDYDVETMKVRKEEFKDLPVEYWIGVSGFFLLHAKMSLELIQNSLERQKKMTKKKQIFKNRLKKLKRLLTLQLKSQDDTTGKI